MKEKRNDTRGETLVEVLASILICSLSVLMLFGAAGFASSRNLAAQDTDAQFYDDLTKAERQSVLDICEPYPEIKITIANVSETIELDPDKVIFYGTERLLSYAAGGGP